MATQTAWIKVRERDAVEPLQTYVAQYTFRSPFPNDKIQSIVRLAVRAKDVFDQSIHVKQVRFLKPYGPFAVGRYEPWALEIEFQRENVSPYKAAGVVDVAFVFGILAAALAILGVISSRGMYRVATVVKDTVQEVAGTVTHPAFLVVALVLGILIFGRGQKLA